MYFDLMLKKSKENTVAKLLEAIRAVTLDDVKRVSKKVFDENNIVIVVIGGNSQ
jgi:predicted Zn-dependent peptidase